MAKLREKLFFSWLEDGKLAALAWPRTKMDIEFLRSQEIRWLVSLTGFPPSLIHGVAGLKCVHLPIPDLKVRPPTLKQQVQEFIRVKERATEKEEAVAVHCQYGCGRTGTMPACYLVKTTKCTATEAMEKVRQMRPGSIETSQQEELVQKYTTRLNFTSS